MTRDTAKEISDRMVAISFQLTESLGLVEDSESAEEYERYREAVSRVLFEVLTGIMNPIYAEHPDLKPRELDETGSG